MYNKIYKTIKKYEKIVIARHIGPDPDSLGAQLGLKEIIQHTFPKKQVIVVGASVNKFKYLGEMDKMTDEMYENSLLILVDIPDKNRIDGVSYEKFEYIIKIDHHPTVDKIANIEWVDETESSASQMVIELCNKTKLNMTKFSAECLFTGVVSDTNRFLFSYTTPQTLQIIANLIKTQKLDIFKLYEQLYLRPMSEIKLHGYIAQNMIIKDGLGYIYLTDELIKEYGVDVASAGNLINEFNNIKELIVWVTFSEDVKQEVIRVSIRSRGPIINTVAENYNGGGHKYASGARIANFEEADGLIKELHKLCVEYNNE